MSTGAANLDFFTTGIKSLGDKMAPEEADAVFQHFPPVQQMPAWQSFLATAQDSTATENTAAAAAAAAKQTAVQQLASQVSKLALLGMSPDKIMQAVNDFTSTVGGWVGGWVDYETVEEDVIRHEQHLLNHLPPTHQSTGRDGRPHDDRLAVGAKRDRLAPSD